MKKHFFTLVLVLAILAGAYAQQDSALKKFSVTPLPIIISDPFMGWGFGALANVNYLLGDPHTTRFSNTQVYALKTTNGQFAAQVNHTIFSGNENWMIPGKLQYLDWPENVFGLGANTSREKDLERISYKALEFEESLMKRFGQKNFIGIQYRLYDCWNLASDKPDSASFFEKNATGNKSFVASSVGLRMIHDSRDNVQNAYSGYYAELGVNPNVKAFGSTQDWTNVRVDLRTYRMLNHNMANPQVLACRFMYEQAFGDVPYMIMPMFGRYTTTRGYVQGRFRGKTFLGSELEYRAHLWKAIGGVLFAGAQTVSEPGSDFRYIHPSAGAGIRIMLNKSQRTNLRIDYARGVEDEGGLYLQVTEAF